MVQPIWKRLKAGNRYVYTQVNRNHQPIQFDSNTGTFRVYTSPNINSHSFDTYITPEQFKTNTINDNNPVQLKEVQITAKKPPEFVGIQRTPDDHQAALARDRAVDAKVNPQNDQLQSFFANLMTGGMYSAVDQGAKNIDKSNYLEGTAQIATPIMFGPAKSTVANLTRLGVGAYNLLSKNGVRKTLRLANNGDWTGAAKSAAGDALNLGMTLGGGYNLSKYNTPSFVQQAARNGNNTARSYLISKELNQNIKNFDGTVGEEYFQNPVPYRWIRVSETPEVHGLQEMGKNVTTTDAYNIHVPSNDWRVSHIKDFVFKDGQWYKKPKKKFSLTKFGQAHGNISQAAYGKVWNGTFAYSGQFPRVRLEGEAYNKVYRGFDPNTGYDSRTNFVLQNVDDIPMGSRVGFHTGEMPMENLQYFQQLPNGRWKIMGQILHNKILHINTPTDRFYKFINQSPTQHTELFKYTDLQKQQLELLKQGGVDISNISPEQLDLARRLRNITIYEQAPSTYYRSNYTLDNPRFYSIFKITNKKPIGKIDIINPFTKQQMVDKKIPEDVINQRINTPSYASSIGMVQNLSNGKEHGIQVNMTDATINQALQRGFKGVKSGEELLQPEKTTKMYKKYQDKIVLNNNGIYHWNSETTNNNPVYLLKSPSQQIISKDELFDPSIIDENGKMYINWLDPNIYKTLIPTGLGLNFNNYVSKKNKQ